MQNNDHLIFKGKGHEHPNLESGDLTLNFQFTPSIISPGKTTMLRVNNCVHSHNYVPWFYFYTEKFCKITTIDKDKVEIKVSDKPHVLKGRGFDEKSDHIAHFHPSIPKNISADLREFYLEFSKDE